MPNEGQTIEGHIRAAIALAPSLKGDPAVDKKWLNKIVARLEEVEVFAVKLYKPSSLNNPANFDSLASSAPACTCLPGMKDTTCPVHGAR